MKKFILTCVVAVGATLGAFAQGTINFANNSSNLVTTNNGTVGNAAVGFLTFGLYGNVQGSSSNSLVLLATTGVGPVAGRFNGGAKTNTFIAGGAIGTFQIRAWSGGFASYELALQNGTASTLVGASPIWEQATGNPNPPATAPASFVFGPGGFTGFTVVPVPEPSTYALMGLAAGSIWMIRRRRS